MSKKLAYERYFWFHRQVKARRYPNAGDVARQFEVSTKTAHRDIAFMADRLDAPLAYDPRRRGYYYTDEGFELPAFWFGEEEVVALVLAHRLAAMIPSRELKRKLQELTGKLFTYYAGHYEVEELAARVSLKNVEYYGVDEALFNRVLQFLLEGAPMEIRYYSPHKDEETRREVFPLHLLNYMGNWHLIAYCRRSRGLRDFALSRIRKLSRSDRSFSPPSGLPAIKEYLERHFGIFSGTSSMKVRVRFSPSVARWVKEQVWHPKQRQRWDRQGRLVLEVPVTDLREIKREILKFGAEAEALSPARLRREISQEISRMKRLYSSR